MKKLSPYIILVLVFCNLSASAKDKCDVNEVIIRLNICNVELQLNIKDF